MILSVGEGVCVSKCMWGTGVIGCICMGGWAVCVCICSCVGYACTCVKCVCGGVGWIWHYCFLWGGCGHRACRPKVRHRHDIAHTNGNGRTTHTVDVELKRRTKILSELGEDQRS